MTAIVITASQERAWIRPLSTLRTRGVGCVVVTLDATAYERLAQRARSGGVAEAADTAREEAAAQRGRALHHALAEYELPTYHVTPGRPLGEVLVG